MVIVVVPYEEIGNVLVIAGAPSSIVAAQPGMQRYRSPQLSHRQWPWR
jgi:hypothetical protein